MGSSLIINSPYEYPSKHWKFAEEGQSHELIKERRPAGYIVADPQAKPYQDKGIFVELPLVNKIRQRVDKWRDDGYPGITGITKALLEHWKDNEQREYPLFFCQIEAIETLIWLIETHESEKTGIDIPSDSGEFRRLCSKLATGTGKTVVMAMLIAWQAINRATYPRDGRFSTNIFIVAPNLTVKERLAVLIPSDPKNYYAEFNIIPLSLIGKLAQAKVLIRNWHALQWETEEKIEKRKSVDKRGVKSDVAYTRDVLGDMANAHDLIVINDEAHHAWRVANSKVKGVKKEEIDEATKWIGGLDRIHKTRDILNCFDFSATPFTPSGNRTSEEALFQWIVSDFGLNDAIEAGLVKTPRIVVDDNTLPDTKTYKPRLYHIYNDPEVKDDLNRNAKPHDPLPQLVKIAYTLLGADWDKTRNAWTESSSSTEPSLPPVMITVANRTQTAARIKYAFDNEDILVNQSLRDPNGILHIDSTVLAKAEAVELNLAEDNKETNKQKSGITQKQEAEHLRQKVNTVGQIGEPGEKVQNVISVGMLSEGWDARTVTHIMGLRAFTSQLLCEQVVGRGLRRTAYEINKKTGLFEPEYVNVFGVPFSFLPQEETGVGPGPTANKITVQPLEDKKEFAIRWPNVIRIEQTYKQKLFIDWKKVKPLTLDASNTPEIAEMAPTVDGKPDISQITDITLEEFMRKLRMQTIIFKAIQSAYAEMSPGWKISTPMLLAELARLAEQFIYSDRIQVTPKSYNQDEEKRKLIIALNMTSVIRSFWEAIKLNNTEERTLILDSNHPIYSTGDMRPWRTGKPCKLTKKSHINYCVCDSTWEAPAAFQLGRNKAVDAWVKNDHLGFSVLYIYKGVVKRYYPDFIIRLKSGLHLVLEVKGQQTEQDDAKHSYMKEWIEAVNEDGRFGKWAFDVTTQPSDLIDILADYAVLENSA